MRSVTTSLLLGGLLLSWPAAAQNSSTQGGPGSNPSKLTADPLAPGPLTVAPPPVHGPAYGQGITDEFALTYHGYLSAAMLAALGSKNPGDENPLHSSTPIHSLTLSLPDYTYNTWLRTNSQPGSWAHVNFSIGTRQVYGTLFMGSWDFNQGQMTPQSATHSQLTLSFMPSLTFLVEDLFRSKTRLDVVVGGVRDRYGGSGKWDYGAYGAVVIGATVATGYTAGLERAFGDLTLRLEQGFGGNGHPPTDPRGTTLLGHVHALANFKDVVKGGLHYMTSWTQDERAEQGDPDGSIRIYGADARFNGGIYGEVFLGGSYVKMTHAQHVDGAIQVVHVAGGQGMMDNFLGPDATGSPSNNNHGTGSLKNVLFQYDYSFGTLARYPEAFWGNGPDLKATLFGMYTKVASADERFNNVAKLKFGARITYSPLDWLAVSTRVDHVVPNLNTDPNVDPETDPDNRMRAPGQQFTVLSPRVIFRSSFVAHETVELQYSHYFYPGYGARGVPQNPKADLLYFNPRYQSDNPARPLDANVFSIAGTMWF